MLADPPPGDVADRLFPRGYLDPTEEDAEQEWQSLVHDDLARNRQTAITTVLADLDGGVLRSGDRYEIEIDEEGQTRWLTVLNDARLSIGTALGVTDDD